MDLKITVVSEAHKSRWNKTYVGWVDISLDNVEDADITGRLSERRSYHSILWL